MSQCVWKYIPSGGFFVDVFTVLLKQNADNVRNDIYLWLLRFFRVTQYKIHISCRLTRVQQLFWRFNICIIESFIWSFFDYVFKKIYYSRCNNKWKTGSWTGQQVFILFFLFVSIPSVRSTLILQSLVDRPPTSSHNHNSFYN